MLKLTINKDSDTPAYRQIIEGVTSLIKIGELNPGDKLPSERELALHHSLARGTIKKAFEKLAASEVIEIIHGRGTFVSFKQNIVAPGRKEQAVKLIVKLLNQLEELKFSHREIGSIIDLKLMERELMIENFYIAAVDCNPECLNLFEYQLGHMAQVKVSKFLLDEVMQTPDPQSKLGEFELIVTTSTHYSELLGVLPKMHDRILQMVLSPSQESIIDLAKISYNQKIGIFCRSKKFRDIIRTRLKSFQIPLNTTSHFIRKKSSDFPKFLADKDILIIPPKQQLPQDKENIDAVRLFRERGGKIITFEYQIERGSLLHVEERIKSLLQR